LFSGGWLGTFFGVQDFAGGIVIHTTAGWTRKNNNKQTTEIKQKKSKQSNLCINNQIYA
jgi:hypothetical protein